MGPREGGFRATHHEGERAGGGPADATGDRGIEGHEAFSFSVAWKAAHDSISIVEQSMTSAPDANGSALAAITSSTVPAGQHL